MFNNIFKKKKLPRLPKPGDYKTGDAQDWTYEYTWEDLEEAAHQVMNTTRDRTPIHQPFWKTCEKIRLYFYGHPEKLLECGQYSSLTLDEIKKRFSNKKIIPDFRVYRNNE